MTNEEKVNKYWQYARNKMKSFKKYYSKLDKNTQDKIQDVFNSIDIKYNQLSSNINNQLKKRIDRKIQEWKEKDIYKGYLKYKIESLYKRNISYKNYLEIMLYGTLYEEKKSVDEYVNILFYDVSNEYYNKGIKDLKQKSKIIPKLILTSILAKEINGLAWNDYLEGLYVTKEQQLAKQYINVLQTNEKLNIESKSFQNTINKLNNQLLSINNSKYSGGLDEYTSAISNWSYLEASGTDNHKVIFISDHCENTTKMCDEMDGLIFNTKDRNVFKRWYGDNQKDLIFMDIDVMGLVVGINQPPITNHFHWCHSMLEYINTEDYLGANDTINISDKSKKEYIEKISLKDVDKKILEYENEIKNKDVEYMYVIQVDGKVFRFIGTKGNVKPYDVNLENSIITHNHPKNETQFSFSGLDRELFYKNKVSRLRGTDYKYTYELNRDNNFKEKMLTLDDLEKYDNMIEKNFHLDNIKYSYEYNYGYKRWIND